MLTLPNPRRRSTQTDWIWTPSLNSAEQNYAVSERECLAVVSALKTLRPCVMYGTYIFHTDHANFHWLLTIDDPSGRLMSWLLRLAKFHFQVKYRKGSPNQQADAPKPLRTNAKTVYDDDDNDIPAFLLNNSNYNNVDDTKLLDIDYHPLDKVFDTQEVPNFNDPVFTSIESNELVSSLLHDLFCS